MKQVTNEKRGRMVDGETPTSAAEQMAQLGYLLGQGYEKGPRGRGCWQCGTLGMVYTKPTSNGRRENEFCGGCSAHRVVEVG